jgi:hypothetical protein
VRITAQLTIKYSLYEMALYLERGLRGFGDGQIFLKTLRASLFNDALSNEPNFGRIHLAGHAVALRGGGLVCGSSLL